MKTTAFIIIIFLIASCAPQKELVRSPVELPPPAAPVIQKPEPKAPVLPVKYKSYLQCDEKTSDIFNSSGIEVLPFVRVIFYDIDGDGTTEMIAGSKDGSLRLYRNSGSHDLPQWGLDANYFDGIRVGAFSAPAAGDIDGDGTTEILVGTGGFSKDSGKVIFYKNEGTPARPLWKRMDMPEINVGNDATPALFDVDSDGRTDIIVGNSTGDLFLFRGKGKGKGVVFVKDKDYFKGINLGMYVVPAVTKHRDSILIAAGNSMGKLSVLERGRGNSASWKISRLPLLFNNFAAPAFVKGGQPGVMDMVVSDGNGELFYFKQRGSDYLKWEGSADFFSWRTLAGPASAPVITEVNGSSFMVVGNINGEIKLFMYEPSSGGLPWVERPGFFNRIKLSGFSRGILTEWNGRHLLITGQQDGVISAFQNNGTLEKPSWSELKQFFRGVPKIMHASPAIFDIDGDGNWELVVGGADGFVKGFSYEIGRDGNPVWEKIEKIFDYAKVGRFASPSIVKDQGKTYLFVGQQDGKIDIFTADPLYWGTSVFYPDEYLRGVQVNNHSSPCAFEKKGLVELAVGDYDGNLKYFTCRSEKREIKEN